MDDKRNKFSRNLATIGASVLMLTIIVCGAICIMGITWKLITWLFAL